VPLLDLTPQALFQGADGTPDVVLLEVRGRKERGRGRVRAQERRVWGLVCLRKDYVLGIRVEERHEGRECDELMLKQLKTSHIFPLKVE
jgi:hypothetical protein